MIRAERMPLGLDAPTHQDYEERYLQREEERRRQERQFPRDKF